MLIELFSEKDTKELVQIEKLAYNSRQLTEREFSLLSQDNNVIKWVIKKKSKIVGFIFYSALPNKEIRILLLAIHPDYQRFGYGSKLLKRIIMLCKEQRKNAITIWVNEYYLPAQLFLKKHGFFANGDIVRKQPGGDIYMMELPISLVTKEKKDG